MKDYEETLDYALKELSSAEDFLEFFGIEYDACVVQVNRLHILQRFHDYIQTANPLPSDDESQQRLYAQLLKQAYEDFVYSDARTEKVFQVFKEKPTSQITLIPVATLKSTAML